MVKVHLWSSLKRFTDGELVVDVQANTIGEMLDALVRAYPGLGPVIDGGISVAVDGDIMPPTRQFPITANSEIFLMQRMRGG